MEVHLREDGSLSFELNMSNLFSFKFNGVSNHLHNIHSYFRLKVFSVLLKSSAILSSPTDPSNTMDGPIQRRADNLEFKVAFICCQCLSCSWILAC